jgi:7-keto-8-aminopelargonate synthetase-like enzyme
MPGKGSAIIPVPIGEETKAVEVSAALRELGIFIPAIRYPTVARGQARLRLTVTAAHSATEAAEAITALRSLNLGNGVSGK